MREIKTIKGFKAGDFVLRTSVDVDSTTQKKKSIKVFKIIKVGHWEKLKDICRISALKVYHIDKIDGESPDGVFLFNGSWPEEHKCRYYKLDKEETEHYKKLRMIEML